MSRSVTGDPSRYGVGVAQCLLLAAGLWLSGPVRSEEVAPAEPVFPTSGEISMDLNQIVQWAVWRNAAAAAARLQADAAGKLLQSERELYTSTGFVRVRREGYDRPRTYEERTVSLTNIEKTSALEQISSGGIGVRGKLPSGASFELSNEQRRRQSNLLASTDERENRGTLTFTIKQPLLRGAGRDAVEADLRVVEKEQQIERQRFIKQLLDTVGEAVGTYWQLIRSKQALAMRENALRSAFRLRDSVQLLVDKGFAPRIELLEAEVAIGSRQTEVARAEQQLVESQSRVCNLLDVSALERMNLKFVPANLPAEAAMADALAATPEPPSQMLELWPTYRIAKLRVEQETLRLAYAQNLERPDLSLEAGYNFNSLDSRLRNSVQDSLSSKHPGWFVGATLEMPLSDVGVRSKREAQQLKLDAVRRQMQSEAHMAENEWVTRIAQLQASRSELRQLRQEVSNRTLLLQAELANYERGRSRLRLLIEAQDLFNDSQQRLLEGEIRYQIAAMTVQVLGGTLLESFGVRVIE